ncbi:MAG: translation initiation factor IF-3 [Candidatus Anammoxibacter sp.]
MQRKRLRTNDRIKAETVRVIDSEGKQLGILKKADAIAKAKESESDLVEVAPNAEPPVCRILNYGKFVYKQKKKTNQKHHTSQLKEIRIRPKTGEHDLQTKINQAKKFIGRNDRVVVNMLFKGREMAHVDFAKEVLKKFTDAMEDVAKIERTTGLMGKKIGITLSPK